MSADDRKSILRTYWNCEESKNDLQDNRTGVLKQRAAEVLQYPELVQELLSNNRFASRLAADHVDIYGTLKHGNTKTPQQRHDEGVLRAQGRTPGTERMFSDGSVGTPNQTFRQVNPAPDKISNFGAIASPDFCGAAGLDPGSTVGQCIEAMTTTKKS